MENISFDKQGAFDYVMKTSQDLSDLENKMVRDYVNIIDSLNKERREMFKYVGMIAGAAAALSPQIFINVQNINHSYFFAGVFFLIVVLIISMLYVMASVENNGVDETRTFKELKSRIQKLKNISNTFLLSPRNENDFIDYIDSFNAINKNLQKEEDERQGKEDGNKNKFYQKLDYASEFILLFFVYGVVLLIVSIINLNIRILSLIYCGALIFILIIFISTFQRKLFVYLGCPIDLIKASVRWVLKNKKRNYQ